jgi:hypothetical protein
MRENFPGLSNPAIDKKITRPRLPGEGFSTWVKHLLACNPFYLVSAALLLYGLIRVSVDPNFLSHEPAQLLGIGTFAALTKHVWYKADHS